MAPRWTCSILRLGGALLVVLGLMHLAVTPFIARMIEQAAPGASAAWLEPPMLLNHVVVGILLLPLGVLVLFAAAPASAGVRWAQVVVRTVAVSIATLPPTLFALMGARYDALPFRIATTLVCVAAVVLLVVAFQRAPAAGSRA